MGGFYGIFHPDGAPVARTEPAAMSAAMAYWGRDPGAWIDGPVGLGSRLRSANPEDAREMQPVHADGLHLAATVRLDERDALCARLDVEPAERAGTPDSVLLLRAYRKWGEACVDHLAGDWACAIWDSARQTLFLARDAAGNSALFYYRDGRRWVFATCLNALFAHPAVPRQPDPLQVGRLLTLFVAPRHFPGATSYKDIHSLPPGHCLAVSARGERLQRYFFPELLPPLELASDHEYDEAFQAIYRDAVADRLRSTGPVALALSAGLDSGSIAALAAPPLADRGERLLAFTHAPLYAADAVLPEKSGDEWPLAQATADHVGNIVHYPLRSEKEGMLGSLDWNYALVAQPGIAVGNYYWLQDLLESARHHGAGVLLTGQGGNSTVSWSGDGNLWPDLGRGKLGPALAALASSQLGPWRALKRQILGPALAPLRRRWALRSLAGQPFWSGYSAIHPAFADEIGLASLMEEIGSDPRLPLAGKALRERNIDFRNGQLDGGLTGPFWMEAGAAYGLDVRDPTRARRVIEFCLRIPDSVFYAQGTQRGLIRRGFRGKLPEEVLESKLRGQQGADVGERIRRERDAIAQALDRLETVPLARSWLDLAKMGQALAAICQGGTPGAVARATALLLRGLAVGLFLETF